MASHAWSNQRSFRRQASSQLCRTLGLLQQVDLWKIICGKSKQHNQSVGLWDFARVIKTVIRGSKHGVSHRPLDRGHARLPADGYRRKSKQHNQSVRLWDFAQRKLSHEDCTCGVSDRPSDRGRAPLSADGYRQRSCSIGCPREQESVSGSKALDAVRLGNHGKPKRAVDLDADLLPEQLLRLIDDLAVVGMKQLEGEVLSARVIALPKLVERFKR